jgi:hypothetical protein
VSTYLARLKAKIEQKPMGGELSKLSKAASISETRLPNELSKLSKAPEPTGCAWPTSRWSGDLCASAQRPVRYPFGYTDAELDAARRDAERLGYGRRTLH